MYFQKNQEWQLCSGPSGRAADSGKTIKTAVFTRFDGKETCGAFNLQPLLKNSTVAWTDYRFYRSKLWFFFPEALTRKSKTIAYMEHLLQNIKGTCFNY